MTFFNKKAEVMQIEMTPYGRYLYSIGKFKPHSYEFVDEDILYKTSGSTEAQEAAHTRIISETPKLKINRAFQDATQISSSLTRIMDKRVMIEKMNQKQTGIYAMGRSSYSSDKSPSFQATMIVGTISTSKLTNVDSGSVFIPQIDINLNIDATLRNSLIFPNQNTSDGGSLSSNTFEDGTYVDIFYNTPIMHMKEFNSFYEKENFEIEVFMSSSDGAHKPLKILNKKPLIVNDMLIEDRNTRGLFPETDSEFMEYFFDIEVDEGIDPVELCKAVEELEINDHFLDEELMCPDQRSDRFDIYATRVSPDDLEDCDD